ncbi:vacuolar membrane protein-domain-containing protein [Hypoxylon sp. NC1633]|nr:vacuolar membrane protein-domain-containing protein [Hypoxylon sp. NC1633]
MSLSSTLASLAQTVPSSIAAATPDATIGVDLPPASTDVSSLLTATATAIAAAATTTMASPEEDHGGEGECRLLGPFALFVQLALGGLALLSLVYKRWRERPQRPIKIWFFDVSKQVFGSVLVHIANVFMSMLTSGRFSIKLDPATVQTAQTAARFLRRDDDQYTPNPCSFYLLNLAIDTTLGIPILIMLLRVVTGLVAYTPWGKPAESIQSGNYGNPPNAWWWLKQSVLYFCGLFGMKVCVLIIFLILPWISRVGDWALKWTEGNERVQIVFVMMLFPLIMNGIQYYIIDSFIKMKETGHERLPSEDGDDRDPFDDALVESDDESSVSGESNESMKLSSSVNFKKAGGKDSEHGHEEYDPDLDGQTVIGSSRSQEDKGRLLPKELAPPE